VVSCLSVLCQLATTHTSRPGQRAVIGVSQYQLVHWQNVTLTFFRITQKCNIDRNSLNPDYVETTNDSFESTKELIEYIRQLHDGTSPLPPLVYPALTPRFALSCTPELLGKIGQLADNDKSLHIQTHISENRDEVRETLKAFPGFPSLAAIYDHFGILSERTILAHGCWVQDEELKLIKERGAGISHCPTSNFNLRSGFARAAEMMRIGVKVTMFTATSILNSTIISGGIRYGRSRWILSFDLDCNP